MIALRETRRLEDLLVVLITRTSAWRRGLERSRWSAVDGEVEVANKVAATSQWTGTDNENPNADACELQLSDTTRAGIMPGVVENEGRIWLDCARRACILSRERTPRPYDEDELDSDVGTMTAYLCMSTQDQCRPLRLQ